MAIMAGSWMWFCCVLFGISIVNTQTSEENCNAADIVVTNNVTQKRIEVRKTCNGTSTLLPSSALVHQGDNLYINPKFVLGSPFSSYEHGYSPVDGVYVTSNIPGSNTVIGSPEISQLSTIVVPPAPPMIIPTGVTGDISIPVPSIENLPQLPIVLPNLPPNVFPMPPYFPPLQNSPIILEKPVSPVIIPEPPKLPPVVLPKLPIQLILQRPIIPIPNHRIVISSICPPMTRCAPNERDSSSVSSIFSDIVQKFKNIINTATGTESTTTAKPEQEDSKPELPVAYPTLCVQGIVAERVVPNVVTNDGIKVFMSPIPPYELAHFNYYRK